MTSTASTRLYATKNDLPEATRIEAIGLLNQRLADCIDLRLGASPGNPASSTAGTMRAAKRSPCVAAVRRLTCVYIQHIHRRARLSR